MGLARASFYRRPADKAKRDAPAVDVLNQIVAKHGRWGFELCFYWMRNYGYTWNHKRVWHMGLNLPRRTKRRLPRGPRIPLVAPEAKNVIWALDFMHDTLYNGKPFRTLNVLEEANRQVRGMPATRVVRVLEQLGEVYGLPEALRLDNGPELCSTALTEWCEDQGIELRYI
jgi:putative transposase